jgi:cytochrome P450
MDARVCIGQNIALVEVFEFMAQFVRQFELESCKPKEPWKTKSHTFAFQSEFWVRLRLREEISEV